MKNRLWTRNYTLLMTATTLGCIGGIAGGYALSLLVFDETRSTLASAIVLAIQIVPGFLMPLLLAPWMDRMPRKPFLVGGDVLNGVLYAGAGVYLLLFRFSYVGYLCFSLLLATLSSFDQLAYSSIYPKLIPVGMEQKGYAVSSMLYPVVQVLMMPAAAALYELLGVGLLLIGQGTLSLLAALIESRISIHEEKRLTEKRYTVRLWWQDIREVGRYFRKEKGLRSIYAYMAVTNGVSYGYGPVITAFFRTAPGLSMVLYSFFSVAEFAGRTVAGLLQYTVKIPAVQQYIPEEMRSRVNSFFDMELTLATSVLSLLVGALGEVLDYRLCVTICGAVAMTACWLIVWRGRREVRPVLEYERSQKTGA